MVKTVTKPLDDFKEPASGTLPVYDELRRELRQWFRNQDRWGSFSELARDIEINVKTLGHYFTGLHFPTGQRRRKLYELTKLECLKEGAVIRRNEAYEKAERTKDLLFQLAEQLEYFKEEEKRRLVFRTVILPKDIGYITSFLKALYDEENFMIWDAVDRLDKGGGRHDSRQEKKRRDSDI